jgi:diguanylate cyclase (GGDEF)-like protein
MANEEAGRTAKPTILVVDDIPANTQLLKSYLLPAGYAVIIANDGEDAVKKVNIHKPDLILLDIMMPKLDGFQVCKTLKSNELTTYTPIIMVTALNDVEDKIKGIEAGADDFITKPLNKMELSARVKSLLRIKNLQDQLQEKVKQLEIAKERLSELAVTDGLTGLYNYRFFKEYLVREIRRASRFHLFISLIMLDIDYFKNYNDTHGHLAGDEILKTLAQLMVTNLRSIDVAARYGGEEFVLVLPETNKTAARIVAEKIQELVENYKFPLGETQPNGRITVSMGIATYPDNGSSVEELINCADRRLYGAKTGGRNKVMESD